jgi:hypothetical protein
MNGARQQAVGAGRELDRSCVSPRAMRLAPGCFVLALALATPAAGQSAAAPAATDGVAQSVPKSSVPAKPRRRGPVLRDDQRHAVGVVDKIAGEARGVDDVADRVRLEARAADLMWDFDQARARTLFRRAFDEAESVTDESGPSLFGGALRSRLLAEVLRRAYVRDAALAEKFLESLDDSSDGIDYGFPLAEDPTEQGSARLAVASTLATTNSVAAVELARSALDEVSPSDLVNFLLVLRRADPPAADNLYAEALTRFATDAAGPAELLPLQPYAIPALEPGAADPWRSFASRPNASLALRYLEAVWAAAQRYAARHGSGGLPDGATATELYAMFASLIPAYEQFDPSRVPEVRGMLGRASASLDPSQRDSFDALSRPETPQAIASRADATSDPALRDALFFRAATLAAATSDDFREVESYVVRAGSVEARRAFLDSVGLMIARRLATARRYDEAIRVARVVPGLDARVRSYLAIAERAALGDDRPRAAEVLDAAELDVARASTEEQALPLALVATAYARIDVLRGAEVMQTAVRAANAARRAVRARADGAGQASRTKGAIDPACFELEPGLERIAAEDYFRALLLAQSLDDKTCSMSAQLAAARGALVRAPRQAPRKSGP